MPAGPSTDRMGADGSVVDSHVTRPDLPRDLAPSIILLTGFGAFAGFPVNPSWESIKPLEGQRFGSFEVRTVELPVEWEAAPKLLAAALQEHRPAIVISAGVAGGETKMRLETTARNEAEGTDNLGVVRTGTPCVAGGPATYATRLPLDRIAPALASSLGAAISDNAGTYICNQIFYHLMHDVDAAGTMAGFIHTPSTSATLDLAKITAAWKAILQVVVTSPELRGPRDPVGAPRLPSPDWPVTVHGPPSYAP
jgi:pyroglutamyl-peptidase